MRFLGAVVLTAAIGCGDDGGFDAMPSEPIPSKGTLALAWTVTDTNSQPITCEQVGAQTVTLSLRNIASVNGEPAVFLCASLQGLTQEVTAGTYQVDFELTGPSGLLATAPRQNGLVVEVGRTTQIPAVTFAVNAVGGLDLFVRATGAAANCTPTSAGGAGITATTITLQRANGGCQASTLTVAPGATRPGLTYTINCSSPQIAPCIESDQRITATNVPSGAYVIHVRGKIGATDCWLNNDSLQVPALGGSLARMLNLTKQAVPGC